MRNKQEVKSVSELLAEHMKENINTPVAKFLSQFLPYIEKKEFEPASDSPASKEIESFERRESLETAFSQAKQSFISATDHLEALDTIVTMKRFAMAPWSCARGMIEASAISAWLLELGIGAMERVSRSLSLRYTALRQQETMAGYDNNKDLIQKIGERIESVENIAVKLGFTVLRDKNGQRNGIAQRKPTYTDLIEKQFKGANLYRSLSRMAHSDYTAMTAFSFHNITGNKRKGAFLIRAVPLEIQSSLVSKVAITYVKSAWLSVIQFGYDAANMAVLFEELYDGLRLPDTNQDRFWRILVSYNI